MKSELIHLIERLLADYPDFQALTISKNGASFAVRQHNTVRFETLADLESYAWPQPPQSATPATPATP